MKLSELYAKSWKENYKEIINQDGEKVYVQIDHIYYIYEGNMERLEKKLQRIKNKCEKNGSDFTFEKLGEVLAEKEVETDYGKQEITLKFIKVRVTGTAKHENWEFVASIEKAPSEKAKGNLVKGIGNHEIPVRYFTAPIMCEHCGNKRTTKSYLVFNKETNEYIQVGKSCLVEFTHGLSADAAASLLNLEDELIKGEVPYGNVRIERWFEVKAILPYVIECIKKFGWVSRSQYSDTESTASRADYYYAVDHREHFPFLREAEIIKRRQEMNSVDFEPNSEKNIETMEAALEWIRGISEEERNSNSYMNNLYLICSDDYYRSKDLGILASLMQAYYKHIEQEERINRYKSKTETEKECSKYVGKIGDRLELKIKEIKVLSSWESNFGYPPQTIRLIKLVDTDNNVYTWKTSNGYDEEKVWKEIEENGFFVIKGTVKEYQEFQGVKQTVLTRCKI